MHTYFFSVTDHAPSVILHIYAHSYGVYHTIVALKHKKFISVYLANRSSTSVTASYKLSLRNQNTNVDVNLFESSGVKTFEVQGAYCTCIYYHHVRYFKM